MQINLFYISLGLVVVFLASRWMKFRSVRKRLPELLKGGALVVDVL